MTCLVMDCSFVCGSLLQDLAYAQVAEYLKPKDSLDYLTHQMHVLENDTKALQLLLGKRNVVFIHSSPGVMCGVVNSWRELSCTSPSRGEPNHHCQENLRRVFCSVSEAYMV